MRSLLGSPLPEHLELTVAVPGFTPTTVQFRRAGTAAAAFFYRPAPTIEPTAPHELHGIAFIFPGVSRDDELEVIRRIAGGHDSTGRLYPVQLRTQRARPLPTFLQWRPKTGNDPSMLIAEQSVARTKIPCFPRQSRRYPRPRRRLLSYASCQDNWRLCDVWRQPLLAEPSSPNQDELPFPTPACALSTKSTAMRRFKGSARSSIATFTIEPTRRVEFRHRGQ